MDGYLPEALIGIPGHGHCAQGEEADPKGTPEGCSPVLQSKPGNEGGGQHDEKGVHDPQAQPEGQDHEREHQEYEKGLDQGEEDPEEQDRESKTHPAGKGHRSSGPLGDAEAEGDGDQSENKGNGGHEGSKAQ